jgi:hypothetical protein
MQFVIIKAGGTYIYNVALKVKATDMCSLKIFVLETGERRTQLFYP